MFFDHMKKTLTDWLPIILLPALAIFVLRPALPGWGSVFTIAFSIFYGFKRLTYRRAIGKGMRPSLKMSIGYIFCWVGMDAIAFFDGNAKVLKPGSTEWVFALSETVAGIILFYIVARIFYPDHYLLAGYIGLAGFLLITFFGTFHILSLIWRRRGVNASPIMKSPLLPSSLSGFWSSRWNLAFRDVTRVFVFRPVLRRKGVICAVLAAFLLSRVLHDLLISLPADAWYGLPTLFFLIQACGVFIEKSEFGIRSGLNRGFRGWLFAAAFILIPLVLLFHPPSIENSLLPFMKAVGAL
jgi:Membrane bound O-acyl transferase family